MLMSELMKENAERGLAQMQKKSQSTSERGDFMNETLSSNVHFCCDRLLWRGVSHDLAELACSSILFASSLSKRAMLTFAAF